MHFQSYFPNSPVNWLVLAGCDTGKEICIAPSLAPYMRKAEGGRRLSTQYSTQSGIRTDSVRRGKVPTHPRGPIYRPRVWMSTGRGPRAAALHTAIDTRAVSSRPSPVLRPPWPVPHTRLLVRRGNGLPRRGRPGAIRSDERPCWPSLTAGCSSVS